VCDVPAYAPTPSSRVRIVFGVALLLIPIQLGVRAVWREPYPALIQPGFAYSAKPLPRHDSVGESRIEVEVRLGDGTTATLTEKELVPWSAGISVTSILGAAFLDTQGPEDRVAWLRDRLKSVLPGARPLSARILEYTFLIDARTLVESDMTIVDEATVTFGDTS